MQKLRDLGLLLAVLSFPQMALALPSYARQTGLQCATCHVSWPELTSVGRRFKLGGYTLARPVNGPQPVDSFSQDTERPELPLAAFVELGVTNTSKIGTASALGLFPRQDELAIVQASLFYGGRITEDIGAFAQVTYDGVSHNTALDNTDIRYAKDLNSLGVAVLLGITVNNTPTVTDIFNTTAAWRFPYINSTVAATPSAAPLIDGGLAQQVAGLGAYMLAADWLYLELDGYKTAHGPLQVFRTGTDAGSAAALSGVAPYWRTALQHDFAGGTQSAEIGWFGMNAAKYDEPDSLHPTGPSDHYRDVGFDAQYQFIGDRDRVTFQASTIHETVGNAASFPAGLTESSFNTLREVDAKATYYRDAKYGFTIGHFQTDGSRDDVLYSPAPVTGSRTGLPNSSGNITEFDWLWERDRRFVVQYTAYNMFNGASENYDGYGRNARDNNTIFIGIWCAF